MIKVYVSPSCLSSKKVINFFEDNHISYIKRNIIQNPLTESEIKLLIKYAPNGFNDIISRNAKYIKESNVKIDNLPISELCKLVQNRPTILKRPIIVQAEKNRVQIGYNKDELEIFLRDVDLNTIAHYFEMV